MTAARKTTRTRTAAPPVLAEAIIIGKFWRNRRGEAVYVQLREYQGRALLDARVYYTAKDGTLQPTPKGLSMAVARLPEFAAALAKAERRARELGLLAEDANGSADAQISTSEAAGT